MPEAHTEMNRIIDATLAVFPTVTRLEFLSARHDKRIVQARQAAMYLGRKHTSLSFPAIARALNRDHTTVLYAVQRVEKSLEDPDWRGAVWIAAIEQYLAKRQPRKPTFLDREALRLGISAGDLFRQIIADYQARTPDAAQSTESL